MELNEMQDMLLEKLKSRMDDDMLSQLKGVRSREEMMEILDSASFELTPDELEMISGGGVWSDDKRNKYGDERDSFDETLVPESIRRGEIDGSMFF